jgi:hypothetical protein
MDQVLSFPADTGAELSAVLLAAVVAVIFGGLAYMLLLRKTTIDIEHNRRKLLGMLSYFVVLICLGVVVFSLWSMFRNVDVVIDQHEIRRGDERIQLASIRQAEIRRESMQSYVNPNRTLSSGRILLIVQQDGPPMVLGDDHYKVDEILRAIRERRQ